jgi:hypothetical protein
MVVLALADYRRKDRAKPWGTDKPLSSQGAERNSKQGRGAD